MKRLFPALLSLPFLMLALGLGADQVSAQTPVELAKNGDWRAYLLEDDSGKTCYMYSQPKKQEGNYSRRGDPYAMVTRRIGNRTVEEVSVTSGYPYKESANVKIKIDGKLFEFGIMHNEHAWADDDDEDRAVVEAMIKGLDMSVRGTSKKDTFSMDTYSLKGFTATHQAIVNACP